MTQTPFFPSWRPQLAPLGARTARLFRQAASLTLCRLEAGLAPWVPDDLFPKAAQHHNSRAIHFRST